MDPEKMDLDAIDQLAWFRIIKFLDNKSLLHCRSLSPTIKSYVDYMGLQLTIDSYSMLKSPEQEAWEEFLSTPEIYFWKVHIAAARGNDLQGLGITLQHQVEALKISGCFRNLFSIVNAKWTRNIVELSFHEYALADRLFVHDVGPSEILLPCLRKLILSVQFGPETGLEWWEIGANSMSNVATLLRRIRSDYLNLIFVEFTTKHSDRELLNFLHAQLLHTLSKSMQSHSTTLQTVIFHCHVMHFTRTQLELTPRYEASMEFTSIPYGLKNVDMDFLPCCIASSPWLNMLSQLKHLEELVARPEYPFISVPNSFMEIIRGVLQNNFRTLKYIGISVPCALDARTLNLGIFGCCSSLERLKLEKPGVWNEQKFFENLPMLPTSLKILNIRGFVQSPRTINTLEPEEIPLMCKFKNLLEFRLEGCLALSSEQLIQFIKIVARLRKLNFLQFTEIAILEEEFIENSNQWQGFFETLAEGQPEKLPHNPDPNPNPSEIEILLERIPWYDSEVKRESEDENGYKEFAGPESRSQIQKIRDDVNGCTNLRTSLILPEVSETKFRIREHYF